MVSHFGEVTFPSSRAFWDDEDEYELAEDLERHAWVNKIYNTRYFIIINQSLNFFNSYYLASYYISHFRQLNVRWLEKKPERMEELIIMEGSPLTCNILCHISHLPINLHCSWLLNSINLISAFVEQCFCRKATKVCTVENESLKEVSAIYHVEKQIYLCLILPQFVVRDAGEFTNQASCFGLLR